MAAIEEISVALPSEQIGAIKEAVDSGEYATASEIVREAIRDWQQKRTLRSSEVELLRRLWDEGKAGGVSRSLDVERIISSARSRVPGDA